jgi:hypothetical protein
LEALDISGLVPNDTAVLEIMKPGRLEKTGWRITMCSMTHPKAQAWSAQESGRQLRISNEIAAAQANGRRWAPEDVSVDEQRRRNVQWAVSRMLDWSPAIKMGPNGEEVSYSDEAATKLFCDPRMSWAFQQIIDFLTEEKSFYAASAKT